MNVHEIKLEDTDLYVIKYLLSNFSVWLFNVQFVQSLFGFKLDNF